MTSEEPFIYEAKDILKVTLNHIIEKNLGIPYDPNVSSLFHLGRVIHDNVEPIHV